MSKYPRASDLPWGTLAVLVVATIGLHVLGGFIDWLARPAARSPAPPPVAVAAMTRPSAPPLPPPLRAPPHSTREELSALLRYLKAGGDLTDSQRRELWDKGIRFRSYGSTPAEAKGNLRTMEIVVPPGYFPADRQAARQPQSTESAYDRWRRLNNVR